MSVMVGPFIGAVYFLGTLIDTPRLVGFCHKELQPRKRPGPGTVRVYVQHARQELFIYVGSEFSANLRHNFEP